MARKRDFFSKFARKWGKWIACYGYIEKEPVIHMAPGEIQGYNVADPSTYSGEVSVWRKNIFMGAKCQLPDYSGVIIYDTAGNIVLPAAKKPLALPWK